MNIISPTTATTSPMILNIVPAFSNASLDEFVSGFITNPVIPHAIAAIDSHHRTIQLITASTVDMMPNINLLTCFLLVFISTEKNQLEA